jgi:hypothetical protein
MLGKGGYGFLTARKLDV